MYRVETMEDIRDMSRGAVLLGTGGGGDPYIGELFVRAQIRKGRYPTIIGCDEIADDAFVVSIAGVGAPSVIVEHLVSENTLHRLLARAESFYGRRIDALISAEIGGANSMFPLALSSISGLPVLDADGIGRAVPQIEMTAFSIFGVRATPALVMDDSGNIVTFDAVSDRMAEDLIRVVTGAMGAMAFGAFYPMTGKQARETAIQNTLTQTLEIGRTIRQARLSGTDIFADLLAYFAGWEGRAARVLFDGKIVDVRHETRDGWHWGEAVIAALDDPEDQCTVEIRNEFLVARRNGRTLAIVPDLITIMDRETGEPLTGEMLSYGQRVKVLGLSADPALRKPESMEVLAPRLFGLDEDFVPLEGLMAAATP
ncbi:hypothetical protein B2G71_12230 [Novosphingobium sp. PC22D]|uniref:DUF917 domain-containing protein n=1 Tax=Novosphingobium sp. PC22D TaxID=1962403 RepID=UPI000BF13648|nr:DUF917 domain-containing protein [Novosphingobium sp. PC22D]PEQ12271.1 hypothetical protein B2G71_12230 [Novosphingobium sp. PC22D]